MNDLKLDSFTFIPASDIKQELKTAAKSVKNKSSFGLTTWTEIGLSDCQYGCKTYARQFGAVIRYVVLHNLTYGHSLSEGSKNA